jgi:hypothetical protein
VCFTVAPLSMRWNATADECDVDTQATTPPATRAAIEIAAIHRAVKRMTP